MSVTRRQLLKCMAAAPIMQLAGCSTLEFGSEHSYLTQILDPKNQNTVFHWVDVAMQAVRDQRVAPPRAAYNFAMPMVAGFLASNSITQEYEEHYGLGAGPQGADPEVAYGMAFATAAAEVFQQPFIFEKSNFLKKFPDSESKSLGIEWGKKVGKAVVRMRNNDGSEASEVNYYFDNYQRRGDSLQWTPTAPFYSAKPGPAFGSFDRGLFPSHGKIAPWTMKSGSQFRVKEFHDSASPEFAREYDLIRRLGGSDSKLRTKDESEIAIFWEDGPWGITPPGHFIYLAIQVLQYRQLSFSELARSFALIGMTQCDASINAWDSKYHHDVLRPESAIRHDTGRFNNSDPIVLQNKGWQSYIPTPSFPSYTSGHSTFGAAGAVLIAMINGTDKVSVTGQSPDLVLWPELRGVTRHWTSLSQMAEENGLSRLYGGVHWELDHTEAMKAGKSIAENAQNNFFKLKK